MRRFSDRHALTTLSELNVTPLLDLAFVLLIIFMITTPLMENSVDLVVPTSEASKNPVNPSAVQTVAIDREERLQFNGEATTREEVGSMLTALHETNTEVANSKPNAPVTMIFIRIQSTFKRPSTADWILSKFAPG